MRTSLFRPAAKKLRPVPQPNRGHSAATARACVEGLEARQMFSVSTSLVDGNLFVQGDGQDDTITIDHEGTTTFVNGKGIADALVTKKIFVRTGGAPFFESDNHEVVKVLATVRPVDIQGQGGTIITPAPNLDVFVGKNGSAQGIKAEVNVHGIEIGNTVTIDNSKDPVGRTAVIDTVNRRSSVTGVAPKAIRFDSDGVATLDVRLGTGSDTVKVLNTHYESFNILVGTFDARTLVDTGAGDDVVEVRGTDEFGTLFVEGTKGNDTVRVGENGSMARVRGDVDIQNLNGFTSVNLNDSADPTARQATLRRSAVDPAFFEVAGLSGGTVLFKQDDASLLYVQGGTGGNTFTVLDTFKTASTASTSTTILDSGSGNDKVLVKRTTGKLNVNGIGGVDVVNVTSNGSARLIQGPVFVANPHGLSTLLVDDSGAGVSRVVTLEADQNATDLTRAEGRVDGLTPARVTYRLNDVKLLSLSTGSANDAFFVHGTAVRTETLLNAGKGNDQFFVGSPTGTMDTIQRKVTVNGQDGTDTLRIEDSTATGFHTYTTFADRFERSGAAPVGFVSIEALDVRKGKLAGTGPMAKDLTFTSSIKAGGYATVAGRLVGANLTDKLTLTVDWGDKSAPSVSMPGRSPFSRSHKYTVKGDYLVRVIWTDSTGQSNFRELKLKVV